PIERASSRIGTTRATTTSTMMMPMVYPTTQPVGLVPAARTCGSITGSSDRFAKVTDGLQARVDRGQPLGHGAGQLSHGLHSPGRGDQRPSDRPEVEDDPEQAHRGDGDDQRGDDDGEPGGSWHGCSPSCYTSSLATAPPYRHAPTETSLTVVSVTASASGTPLSSPTRAPPPDRMSSVA